MKVKQSLLKYISPQTPEEIRLKAACGEPPEALSPEDVVTCVFVLCYDKTPSIAEAARKRFEELPLDLLLSALEKRLDALIVKKIVSIHKETDSILMMAALNEGIDDETLRMLAETGPEEVVEVIADEKELLEEKPFLIEAIRKNPLTPKLVLSGLSVRELPKEPRPKPEARVEKELPKDLTDDKNFQNDEQNIYKLIKTLSAGQKIKLALTGNKAAREFLIKDSNKLVALSVLKNPRITEDEVTKVSNSKSSNEDLIRQIARNKEWVKNYGIKLSMATNPKTPLTISVKLLDSLYARDLEKLSKSKNIPSVLASTARRKLETKKKD